MKRGRAKQVVLLSVGLFVAYLLAWPVPIDPHPWTPPPVPAATGVLEPNTLLRDAERLGVGIVDGPEDIAIAADGRTFVGTHTGLIQVISADGATVTTLADTGGRPLGLAWDHDGNLIVADAMKGLLSVSPSGEVTTLSTESAGGPYKFTDDVDIAKDGRIYFSDASVRFGYGEHMDDILEGRAHGRLMRYDPETQETETLLSELYFANGVALATDDSFVLINETSRHRIRRLWLAGPNEGTAEIFADGLPGYVDGVSRSPRGTFWVAVFAPRSPAADTLTPRPFLTKVARRIPQALLPKPERYGLVLELDETGKILRSLHDPGGAHLTTITSAEEVDGVLYLGSLKAKQVGRLQL